LPVGTARHYWEQERVFLQTIFGMGAFGSRFINSNKVCAYWEPNRDNTSRISPSCDCSVSNIVVIWNVDRAHHSIHRAFAAPPSYRHDRVSARFRHSVHLEVIVATERHSPFRWCRVNIGVDQQSFFSEVDGRADVPGGRGQGVATNRSQQIALADRDEC
jgi:hypothetical protein